MAEYKSNIMRILEQRMPGFHPLVALAEISVDDGTDLKTRVDCLKTLAPYCEPQLKSIEIHGDIKHDFGVLRVIMDEDDEDDENVQVASQDKTPQLALAVLEEPKKASILDLAIMDDNSQIFTYTTQ